MKQLLSLLWVPVLLIACQTEQPEQRYFTSSPEIDTAREVLTAFIEGNHAYYREVYAADAEIFHNSLDAKTVDAMIADEQGFAALFPQQSVSDEEIDMVIDDKGEKWVGLWFTWKGTSVTGKEVVLPVHISARFEDGKIVEEWGYWDTAPVLAAAAEAEAMQTPEAPEE